MTEKLGVRAKVSNFTLPLGATMNMDGTALYEGANIPMTAMTTLLIFITAVLAAIGAAATRHDGAPPGRAAPT